jgi:hypothetical protein
MNTKGSWSKEEIPLHKIFFRRRGSFYTGESTIQPGPPGQDKVIPTTHHDMITRQVFLFSLGTLNAIWGQTNRL